MGNELDPGFACHAQTEMHGEVLEQALGLGVSGKLPVGCEVRRSRIDLGAVGRAQVLASTHAQCRSALGELPELVFHIFGQTSPPARTEKQVVALHEQEADKGSRLVRVGNLQEGIDKFSSRPVWLADPAEDRDSLTGKCGYRKGNMIEFGSTAAEVLKVIAVEIELRVEARTRDNRKRPVKTQGCKLKVLPPTGQDAPVESLLPTFDIAHADFNARLEKMKLLLHRALDEKRLSTVHLSLDLDTLQLPFLGKTLVGDRPIGEKEGCLEVEFDRLALDGLEKRIVVLAAEPGKHRGLADPNLAGRGHTVGCDHLLHDRLDREDGPFLGNRRQSALPLDRMRFAYHAAARIMVLGGMRAITPRQSFLELLLDLEDVNRFLPLAPMMAPLVFPPGSAPAGRINLRHLNRSQRFDRNAVGRKRGVQVHAQHIA